ncbi:uncharacterized protein TNCV_5010911 [Trichonephila clavipes]|nr:uncharacterized protein TNCV_5010911 [Trichonephila clavipes]
MPNEIKLADYKFNIPGKINVLLGAEIFYELLRPGQIYCGDSQLLLQNTVFGYVVSGRIDALAQPGMVWEEKGLFRVQLNSTDDMCEEKEEASVDVIRKTAKEDFNPVVLSKEPVNLDEDETEEGGVEKPTRKLSFIQRFGVMRRQNITAEIQERFHKLQNLEQKYDFLRLEVILSMDELNLYQDPLDINKEEFLLDRLRLQAFVAATDPGCKKELIRSGSLGLLKYVIESKLEDGLPNIVITSGIF